MSLFHRHNWKIVNIKFQPPSGRALKFRGFMGAAAEAILNDSVFGFTTLSLRCETCGDVGLRRLVGEWEGNEKEAL